MSGTNSAIYEFAHSFFAKRMTWVVLLNCYTMKLLDLLSIFFGKLTNKDNLKEEKLIVKIRSEIKPPAIILTCIVFIFDAINSIPISFEEARQLHR
jgi:hypothetical protein